MRIIFFGTSAFSAYVLQALIEKGYEIVAVVTRPDRPQGRGQRSSASSVKKCIQQFSPHTPLFQPEKASDPTFVEKLVPFDPDLFVVFAYGEIIKKNLLDLPKKGCINVHPSLLPKFRGAAPMQRSLMVGVKQTGITIIEMALEMDAGDILAVESIDVPEEITLGELEDKMRPLAVELVTQVLEEIRSGTLKKEPQDPSLVTFASKIKPEDEKIDWAQDAHTIHNQIRALSPSPGAWCELVVNSSFKRLKIKKSRTAPLEGDPLSPGSFVRRDKQGWIVACGQGALELQEVQLEGKRVMSAQECLRGLPKDIKVKI